MTISIGIPTFGRSGYLLKTIDQVLQQQHKAVIEILICDQTHEEDKSPAFKAAIQKYTQNDIVYYFSSEIINLPNARNKIISKAKGDIILWLDDDVILPLDFIAQHYDCYTNDDLGCKVIAVAGLPYHRKPNEIDAIEKINLSNYLEFTTPHYKEKKPIYSWLHPMIGANHSVLKNNAIEIGGYDEHMIGPAFYEDADFTLRLTKHFIRNRVCYNPYAMLIHLRAPTGGCRIAAHQKLPSYSATLSVHIYYFRHITYRKSLRFMWQSLRIGPLRKDNMLNPLSFLSSCWGFFNSLFLAYKKRKTIKSILKDNDRKSK